MLTEIKKDKKNSIDDSNIINIKVSSKTGSGINDCFDSNVCFYISIFRIL